MSETTTTPPNFSPSWMKFAICHGKTKMFFAPYAERPQARVRRELLAKAMCRVCPVSEQCRDYARENREYGVWGGEAELERHNAGYELITPIGVRHRPKSDLEKSPSRI